MNPAGIYSTAGEGVVAFGGDPTAREGGNGVVGEDVREDDEAEEQGELEKKIVVHLVAGVAQLQRWRKRTHNGRLLDQVWTWSEVNKAR